MLAQPEAVLYLLERELISPQSLVEGDLMVLDASRRNHNFKVVSKTGPCYLLKQSSNPDSGMGTLAHEAAVYQSLLAMTGSNVLRPYLPRFYGYDPKANILVVELLSEGEDFREYHTRLRYFSPTLAKKMGKALSTLHSLTRRKEKKHGELPWALFVNLPDLQVFRNFSSAQLQLIKILQSSDEFCSCLSNLRKYWQAEALIHGDVKWDNCIVFAGSNSKRKARLKIVDWELASLGDPCWDAGSVFSNYLSFWLLSIPIMGESLPDRYLELSPYPLKKMQPAIRSFWRGYVAGMGLDVSSSDQWLLRATKYAAARLIQTGLEQMQQAAHLPSNLICLLQLSVNILRKPREAIAQLLGIPLWQMRSS